MKSVPSEKIGPIGEKFVADFLIQRGFSLYKTNVRKWDVEFDVIMYKIYSTYIDLRLVEVKTRSRMISGRRVCLVEVGDKNFDNGDFCTLESYKLRTKIQRYVKYGSQIAIEVNDFLQSLDKGEPVTVSVKSLFCKISIDLAVVCFDKTDMLKPYKLCKYYQNVNLLI